MNFEQGKNQQVVANLSCTVLFKKIKNYKSFALKQSGWKFDEENKIFQVCGQSFKYFHPRKISGKIKTITIKRDNLGDFYIFVVTVARIYKKSANQRKDFLFKLAKKLCLEYEKIFIEDSKIREWICPKFGANTTGI